MGLARDTKIVSRAPPAPPMTWSRFVRKRLKLFLIFNKFINTFFTKFINICYLIFIYVCIVNIYNN
jgi:hypothetical protein